jgi:polynucleotide 5'-hydroxyl-kinase GRC3/NOL9
VLRTPPPLRAALATAVAALAPAAAAAAAAAGPPVCAVVGGKGTGKSTAAVLLVNALLAGGHARVAFLECDLGQPEFSPPGVLALTLVTQPVAGPAYTRHAAAAGAGGGGPAWHRAVFVGADSPRADPLGYLAALAELFAAYLCGPAWGEKGPACR